MFARSIASAQPLPEHEVVLLSRGNEPIGKAVTDADGRATFPAGLLRGRGAAEATSIMVTDADKQEFSRLELTKAAFDLSDRGIEGRALPGPVDAFLYTERGVYRPGETVQLMAMLRDDSAVALKDMPVTLIVKRPDGSEFTRYTLALPGSGALHQAIDLPKSSRRGLWSVAAYIDPKAAPVGRVEFSVEDFVPEKLKVELSTDGVGPAHRQDDQLRSLGRLPLRRARLGPHGRERPAHHGRPQSLPRLRQVQLRLGRGAQELRAAADHARRARTPTTRASRGSNGPATRSRTPTSPLRAQITARVFEPGNGRATKTDKSLPLRTRDVYLGVSPTFEGRYAREGTDTAFDLVALDADGKQIADSVDYSIVRITYDYQWYQSDGRWRWQSTTREREVDAGTLALKADAPVNLSKRLQWGPHRLTVTDKRANTSTTVTFYVGWYGGSSGAEDAPDTLKVASDREKYAPGDTAKLRIEAPFAGEAVVTIATDRVLATYSTQVAAGGTTIDIPVKGEWGAGAYALVTAWRPLASPAERTPVRAIGAVWLGLDPALRTLAVQIAAPEKVTPRQRIEVPLRVANAQGSEAYVTLAAVDEGILQLTRFKTPQPADYYFGKRRLGLDDARRLRPPARRQGRRARQDPHRRRRRRHRRARRRADPHRGAVQRPGEARRQGRGQDHARDPRLHRPAAADGGRLRQGQGRLGRGAAVRARRRHRRRDPAALPRAQRHRPRGAVAAQRRRPGRRLQGDPGGDRLGRARTAGVGDQAARRQPARADDLAAARRARSASARSRSRSAAPATSRSAANGTSRSARRRRRARSTRSPSSSRRAS